MKIYSAVINSIRIDQNFDELIVGFIGETLRGIGYTACRHLSNSSKFSYRTVFAVDFQKGS